MPVILQPERLCRLSQEYHEANTTIVTVGGYDCCGPTFAGVNWTGRAKVDHYPLLFRGWAEYPAIRIAMVQYLDGSS
jgi:hypothetical protein